MQYRCSVVQCILHLYCSQNSVAAVHTAHAVYKYTAYILQGNCSTLVVYTAESVRCTSSVYCIYTVFRSGSFIFPEAKNQCHVSRGHVNHVPCFTISLTLLLVVHDSDSGMIPPLTGVGIRIRLSE